MRLRFAHATQVNARLGIAPVVGGPPFTPATSMALMMAIAAGAAIMAYGVIARPSRMPAFDRESQQVDSTDSEKLTARV